MEAATQTMRHLADSLPEKGVYPNFFTDSVLNREAPSSTVAFGIGGALMFLSAIMLYRRVQTLVRRRGAKLEGLRLVQGVLACFFDNDDPLYTAVSFTATSFLFLGGFQENFSLTWSASLGVYFLSSVVDTSRTFLALASYDGLADPQLRADIDRSGIVACHDDECRQNGGKELDRLEAAREAAQDAEWKNTEVEPGNIYEDMGRDRTIVVMVFLMQLFFISTVCIYTYDNGVGRAFDGTSGCPIVHTVGSYLLYVIGIFLACVYMLGPRTDYGRSEQSPEFWLILFLAAKDGGFKILWDNPRDCPVHRNKGFGTLEDDDGEVIKDEDGVTDKIFHTHILRQFDTRLWRRFIMSFLCNGVGFHILVHALPIGVAMQNSWLGAVYRSVGMMYLVDLDDTTGFPLTIARVFKGTAKEKGEAAPTPESSASEEDGQLDIDRLMKGKPQEKDEKEMARQAQEIIDKAHDALDKLQLLGPTAKAERPTMAKHRQISSETVIMSVIGYGVQGLGGSGKKKNV